ncbi:hypothetical protein [Aliikangiella sp. IMCC44632]
MIETQKDFSNWLDKQLDVEIPGDIIAFNININESPFNIEIVGSTEYDAEDEDWACSEDWIPQARSISVSQQYFGDSWEDAQKNLYDLCKVYINSDSPIAKKLSSATAFAIGFVDGNLQIVE